MVTSSNKIVALNLVILFTILYFATRTDASPLVHRYNSTGLIPRWVRPWQEETGSDVFREQMKHPSEVFSVLLIIGGDIVQKAVAQMSGRRLTFVAFSFGWVAYAFNSLMSAFGDGSLMPDPEFSSEVITISSGIKKQNNSWVICRLIRDLERTVVKTMKGTWLEKAAADGATAGDLIETIEDEIQCSRTNELDGSLLVTMCTALPGAGKPHRDWHFTIYLIIILVQHAVAMIPTILYGNWSVLFLTGIGTILAICTTSLSEWRLEKYQARRHSKNSYAITRGNGHRHVFVIEKGEKFEGKFPGLFLDDLAGAVRKADEKARLKTACLAVAWVFFLITAGGLKDNTWYLLLVGIIGMAQNIWVAGSHQTSEAHGIPVRIGRTFGAKTVPKPIDAITKTKRTGEDVFKSTPRMKVMEVLMRVEKEHPTVGAALRPEFFPEGSLRPSEKDWWGQARAHYKDPIKNPFPELKPIS